MTNPSRANSFRARLALPTHTAEKKTDSPFKTNIAHALTLAPSKSSFFTAAKTKPTRPFHKDMKQAAKLVKEILTYEAFPGSPPNVDPTCVPAGLACASTYIEKLLNGIPAALGPILQAKLYAAGPITNPAEFQHLLDCFIGSNEDFMKRYGPMMIDALTNTTSCLQGEIEKEFQYSYSSYSLVTIASRVCNETLDFFQESFAAYKTQCDAQPLPQDSSSSTGADWFSSSTGEDGFSSTSPYWPSSTGPADLSSSGAAHLPGASSSGLDTKDIVVLATLLPILFIAGCIASYFWGRSRWAHYQKNSFDRNFVRWEKGFQAQQKATPPPEPPHRNSESLSDNQTSLVSPLASPPYDYRSLDVERKAGPTYSHFTSRYQRINSESEKIDASSSATTPREPLPSGLVDPRNPNRVIAPLSGAPSRDVELSNLR